MRYSESKSCQRHNFEAKSKIWQQIFTWKFVYTHWNEDRAWFIFANESCKSRCNRLVETQKAFLLSILHYLRSRALPYHYSDKTCETFAKANVSGVKLQKLFVRITVDFTLYGDVRAIKDFCANFGSLWFCHIKNAWVFSLFCLVSRRS